jgi:hypothetical protein
VKRLILPLLATAMLAACSNSAATSDTTVPAGSDTTVPAGSDTTVPAGSDTTAPASTDAPAATTTTLASSENGFSGTQKELALASINGATYAAVALNSAMLQKAGWSAPAATTESSVVVQKRSTREAQVVISAIQSAPPKGFTVTGYGSEGIVVLYDGSTVQAKGLTGLVEYIEISQKGASVCLRPSTDGNKDSTQMDVANDGYRAIPVGQLIPPSSSKGWIILLRTSQKAACRLALDTLAAP